MNSVISNSLVANLKPADKPYEVRDTRLKGLLLRVQSSGVMSYYVEYDRGKRINLGRADAVAPAQARDQAKAILADVYKGNDPAVPRKAVKEHTLRTFLDELYDPWARAHVRSYGNTMIRLRVTFASFLDKKLGEITPLDVEKWRTGRLNGGTKPGTVNRDLDDLKSSLNKATSWIKGFSNPIANVKRVKLDANRKVRFLSVDEERRLRIALDEREERIRQERDNANEWRLGRNYDLLPDLRAVSFADHLKPMVLVSLNTGMRRGELFGLTWREADLDRREITVDGAKAKSGQTRHIPLNDEGWSVLSHWRTQVDSTPLVFPNRDGGQFNNVRKSWEALLLAAKIEEFRWHDIRHTFASKLVMVGVDLNTVRELLGHSDIKMTLRYAHLAPEHKAAAVAKLVGA
ncbi:MAG: site-specific integrase [Rhodospirillaceae bacterium]